MTDLDGEPFKTPFPFWAGSKYCSRFDPSGTPNPPAWQVLRHWSRVALRRRDMQEWIVNDWLNNVWNPAFTEVLRRPHGTVEEALVIARIWSSAKGQAITALNSAGSMADPRQRMETELRNYAARSDTNKERAAGVMRRPGAAYAFIATVYSASPRCSQSVAYSAIQAKETSADR